MKTRLIAAGGAVGRVLLASLMIACARAPGGVDASPDRVSSAPCARPAPRDWREGDTLVIAGDPQTPCTFTVHETELSIASDDALVPTIGDRLVRDRRGR